MDFEVKFNGLTRRWFLNIFLIIVAVVAVAVIVSSIFLGSLYIERVENLADFYSYDFATLSDCSKENFEDVAIEFSNSFQHKTKIEVQVLDENGQVFVSTTGFQPEDDRTDDFKSACKEENGISMFKGKLKSGEKVLSSTVLLKTKSGEVLGAYRWITSLAQIDRRITNFVFLFIVIGLAILLLCSFSGLFFIKSIVKPIKDVSNIARKIAMGDFESRIEIKKNDEIGELCDTINYMAVELHQAETMKNDFISSVSHELRTPLTAIRGWGETAKMSVGTDEELVSRGLEVMLSETDRLSSLVEELLDFSRMQTGRLSLNTVPIDVSKLLEDAANMYTELAVQQGIELSFTAPAEDSIVLGDADRLKQVFINIIDNAVKYTEKGGLVLVVQTKEDGCVRIQVKDTGVGIPAQDIDRVKEKFFKSNKTVRGSGIGLAVADEIIKQHQGLLFIESTESVGTTVTIVLPLYDQAVEDEKPEEETIALSELVEEAAEELPVNEEEKQTASETEKELLEEIKEKVKEDDENG